MTNTHGYIMKNGKHAGQLITRVPVSCLRWMVGARHTEATWAEAEMQRRGTVLPDMDISGHAIDRASLHCRDFWQKTRNKEEGLHAWLLRVAADALVNGTRDREKIRFAGMKFVFHQDGVWPVLKTVMRDKGSAGQMAEGATQGATNPEVDSVVEASVSVGTPAALVEDAA